MTKQEWLAEHFASENVGDEKAGRKWVQDRPANVREVMGLFPPSCLVRLKKVPKCRGLCVHDEGLVRRYYELDSGKVALGVAFGPDETLHRVSPDECEIVREWNWATREWVGSVLQ